MNYLRFAIMGTGVLATKVADTVNQMLGVYLYAISSDNYIHAKEFSEKYNVKKYYDSHQELTEDVNVDLIYICTPTDTHFEYTKLCLLNKKNVLCEAPIAVTKENIEELMHISVENNTFFAEAMLSRYMPSAWQLQQMVNKNTIGNISSLSASVGADLSTLYHVSSSKKSGGALLNIGLYSLAIASIAFGTDIVQVSSAATLFDTGVDALESIILQFKDGKIATLENNVTVSGDNLGILYGKNGIIHFWPLENIQYFELFDDTGKKMAEFKSPAQISGYEYAIAASMEAIANGEIECVEMPHNEILRIVTLVEQLRNNWGIVGD